MLSLTPTELREMPHGATLEYYVGGEGDPTTVFAHGLAGGIPDTRPLGSGVGGRKVFFQFRGHGRSDPPAGPIGYADLAADLRAVADEFGGTRAVGVSLGAGALCRLLADHPQRYERAVFFLPALLDTPRPAAAEERLSALLGAVEAGDAAAVSEIVSLEAPAEVRNTPAVWSYLRQRIDQLMRDGLAPGLATLADEVAVPSPAALADVTTRSLVIASTGDELHPVVVAEQLAAALPRATLHVYDEPGVLWTRRADLRERISSFLND